MYKLRRYVYDDVLLRCVAFGDGELLQITNMLCDVDLLKGSPVDHDHLHRPDHAIRLPDPSS